MSDISVSCWTPAPSVAVKLTVVQFCQPPVFGTLTTCQTLLVVLKPTGVVSSTDCIALSGTPSSMRVRTKPGAMAFTVSSGTRREIHGAIAAAGRVLESAPVWRSAPPALFGPLS